MNHTPPSSERAAPAEAPTNSAPAAAPAPARTLALLLPMIAAALVAVMPALFGPPLERHEIFVAQTAREMVQRGDWVLPTFNAAARLNKPPLMYWVVALPAAAADSLAAVPPWLARLPSAGAGVALVALTVVLGAIVYGRGVGCAAGLIAAGTAGFFEFSGNARPEMLYASCCALLMTGLAGAWFSPDGSRKQLAWATAAWFGAALAILAKGPHVPALIIAGAVLHAILAGRARPPARVFKPLMGLAIVLALALPWVIMVVARRPDATAIWTQQLFEGRPADPEQGVWNWLSPYYLYGFPQLLLPWGVLLPFALAVSWVKAPGDFKRGRILFWAIVATVLVMGLSNHRRDYYLLPLLAPAAVLTARAALDLLSKALASRRPRALLAWAGPVLFIAAAVGASAVAAAGADSLHLHLAWALGVAAMAALAVVWVRLFSSSSPAPLRLLVAGALLPVAFLTVVGGSSVLWSADRYVRWKFVEQVAAIVGPSAELSVYDADPDEFAYRLGRPVRVLPSAVALAEPGSDEGSWVVVSAEGLSVLDRRMDVRIEAREGSEDAEDERFLVRCEPAPAATPVSESK